MITAALTGVLPEAETALGRDVDIIAKLPNSAEEVLTMLCIPAFVNVETGGTADEVPFGLSAVTILPIPHGTGAPSACLDCSGETMFFAKSVIVNRLVHVIFPGAVSEEN